MTSRELRLLATIVILSCAVLFLVGVNIYQASVIRQQAEEVRAVAETFCGKVI